VEGSLELAVRRPAISVKRGAILVGVFTVALFMSSTLLFLVQPMFAKMILPLLGGTPAVWNTAMLFFQAVLLGGYLYAHASIAWLGVRRQAALHLLIVALPLLILPISVPADWAPPNQGQTLWLLLLLCVSLGPPFFVVSSTAPLLQSWFATTRHRSSGDPYFLYAASNLGSMLSLLAYPLFVESRLRLADQTRVWTFGYGLFVVLIAGCAVAVWRRTRTEDRAVAVERPAEVPVSEPLSLVRRLRWIALAFVPSSLMLGVTSYLTTDIASVPLLWIVPLSLYLLSFILVFSPTLARSRGPLVRVLPFLLLALAVVILVKATGPTWLMIPLHLGAFFAAAVVLHGELSRDRPSTRHLTQFYLWIAVGGVLGGLFNALIAPIVFNSVIEYPVAIVLAALLMPSYSSDPVYAKRSRLDVAIPLGVGILAVALALGVRAMGMEPSQLTGRLLAIGIPVVLILSFDRRPVRFGSGIAALLIAAALPIGTDERPVYSDRSFFSVHRVMEDPDGRYRELVHGNTIHGRQDLDPERTTTPLTYYHRTGPLGAVFPDILGPPEDLRVGVIGLGTGTMACYKRPGERWTFYEIDPQVERIARNPRLFTFLRDCAPEADVVLGDARLKLASAPDEGYGILVVDAFSSDSIPVHLVTREAVALYRSKLSPDGVLMFHISNRYLDLRPVLANLAADAGMVAQVGEDLRDGGKVEGRTPSIWVAMAEDTSRLASLSDAPLWRPLPPDPRGTMWTDDFSNVLSVLRWR
jgi:hypothetical protein